MEKETTAEDIDRAFDELDETASGRVAIGAKTVYNLPALEPIDGDEAPKAVEDNATSFSAKPYAANS